MGLGSDEEVVVDESDGGGDGGRCGGKSYGGSVSCSICLEVVADKGDRSWAKLQCGHQFHLVQEVVSEPGFGLGFAWQSLKPAWQLKMRALLVQQGLLKTLKGVKALPNSWTDEEKEDFMERALGAILLTLSNEVLREVSIKSAPELWIKLESLYMTKSLAKRLYLKKSLHTLRMDEGTSIHKHVDEFNKLMMDLKSVDDQISDEDYAITLLCSLSPSYEHFVDTMLFGRESISLEDVKVALNSKELKNKVSDTQDGALVVQGRNKERSKLGKNTCSYCYKEGHWKVDCPKLKGKKKSFDKSFASVDANIAEDCCSELL